MVVEWALDAHAAVAGAVLPQFMNGDEVLAAVLDRFLHHATVFSQTGESYRLRDAKRRGSRS
jgi:hypothetical protein